MEPPGKLDGLGLGGYVADNAWSTVLGCLGLSYCCLNQLSGVIYSSPCS